MKVVYTQAAREDLMNIYEYISQTLLAPDAARALSEQIMAGARSLCELPEREPLWKWEPWRSLGVRFLPVKNYLLFFTLDQATETVCVVRILYGGRDVNRQLEKTTHWE